MKVPVTVPVPVAAPTSHNSYKIKCPVCGKLEKSHTNANKHLAEAHPRYRFTCHTCKKKFMKKNFLYKHERRSHLERTFRCNKCNKLFVWEADL